MPAPLDRQWRAHYSRPDCRARPSSDRRGHGQQSMKSSGEWRRQRGPKPIARRRAWSTGPAWSSTAAIMCSTAAGSETSTVNAEAWPPAPLMSSTVSRSSA
jgi:hypothetical protein